MNHIRRCSTQTCVTTECYCTPAVASSLQACANCFVTDTPVTSVISAVQALLDSQFSYEPVHTSSHLTLPQAYKSKCAGVLNPVLTIASNTLTTTPKYTPTRTRTSSKVFVTGVMTQTVTVGASTDASAVSNLPTAITKNSSSKTSIYWNTFVVAIGAMIGTALVL